MGHMQGAKRHDVLLFPERLDDDIAEDNPVRFLDACVDALDLEASGFQRAVPATTGRPGSAPGELLTLYLYGDLSRLRSRRRWEQETHRNVAWLWLLKKLRPAHKPSADCRQNNLQPLRQVCRTCTLLSKKLNLFGAERVAIDGSKCRAVNAKERTVTPDKLTTLLAQIDERVDTYLKELECSDDQDNRGPGGGAHAEALAAQIAARKQRQRRYEGFQTQRRSSGQAPLSLTDPERRAMKRGTGRGPAVCDNVQTAVDAQHTRMVACDGTHEPGDRAWLRPMALQAKAGRDCPWDAVADGGY